MRRNSQKGKLVKERRFCTKILDTVRTDDWRVEKYQDLAFKVKRIHYVETAILPVVIGALETVTKRLIRSIGDIIASTQMTALLEQQRDESLTYKS